VKLCTHAVVGDVFIVWLCLAFYAQLRMSR